MFSSNTKTRRVILESTGDAKPTRQETVPVIVQLHGDGWVEVYGPRFLWVAVVNRLYDTGPAAMTADMANLVDQYHEIELPRKHRPFFVPVCLRATGMVRRRTPEGDSRIAADLAFVRGCVSLAKERKKARATT